VYQLLPTVYQNLHLLETGEMKHFMIVVVSPLEYIRQQQVANVARTMCGVRAAAIGESEENDNEISEGKYNIVYGGAEQWLNNRWKKCLQYGGLHQSKIMVVDEVHTIQTCEMCMI
jgi:superfamily II DNA helicase RecQ